MYASLLLMPYSPVCLCVSFPFFSFPFADPHSFPPPNWKSQTDSTLWLKACCVHIIFSLAAQMQMTVTVTGIGKLWPSHAVCFGSSLKWDWKVKPVEDKWRDYASVSVFSVVLWVLSLWEEKINFKICWIHNGKFINVWRQFMQSKKKRKQIDCNIETQQGHRKSELHIMAILVFQQQNYYLMFQHGQIV